MADGSDRASLRLDPPRTHGRREVLRRLRQTLESVLDRWVVDAGEWTVVDVGAGSAPYRPLVEPRVGRYRTADLAGNGAELEIDRDGRVPLPDGTADLVLSNQVLEHVDDPAAHLEELRRLLRRDGLLLLSTHGYWMYHPVPRDYWRWTGPGLVKIVEEAGFQVDALHGVLGRGAAGVQLLQDALLGRLPGRLRRVGAWCFQTVLRWVDRLDRSDRGTDACVFVVVARAPTDHG